MPKPRATWGSCRGPWQRQRKVTTARFSLPARHCEWPKNSPRRAGGPHASPEPGQRHLPTEATPPLGGCPETRGSARSGPHPASCGPHPRVWPWLCPLPGPLPRYHPHVPHLDSAPLASSEPPPSPHRAPHLLPPTKGSPRRAAWGSGRASHRNVGGGRRGQWWWEELWSLEERNEAISRPPSSRGGACPSPLPSCQSQAHRASSAARELGGQSCEW